MKPHLWPPQTLWWMVAGMESLSQNTPV